jgi:hypothetical protein
MTRVDTGLDTQRLFAPASLRQRWVEGRLADEWFEAYRGFFTDEDLMLTRNQRTAHFGEWFAALDYRIHGNEVYIEKYVRKPSTHSYKRAKDVLGKHFEFIRAGLIPGRATRNQPPDLLVIGPTGDYFFAEVKVKPDRLKPGQRDFFSLIAQRTGRKVVLVEVEILRSQPSAK